MGVFGCISSIIGKKHLVIKWLSWLPNNGGFINYNVLETLRDSCSTPSSLKILHQRVHGLVGGPLSPPPFENGSKRLKSGGFEFPKVDGVDNF